MTARWTDAPTVWSVPEAAYAIIAEVGFAVDSGRPFLHASVQLISPTRTQGGIGKYRYGIRHSPFTIIFRN